MVAPTRRLKAEKQATAGGTQMWPQWYLALDGGRGWMPRQAVPDEQSYGG